MGGSAQHGAGSPAPVIGPDAAAAAPDDREDAPTWSVEIWPNRSLTQLGRKRVVWLLGCGFIVPLAPLVKTPVLWIPLAFALTILAAVSFALRRNTEDGRLLERVRLWPDEMRVERFEPSGRRLSWSADPYFVRLHLHEDARPENYLTVTGGAREIELGAFLAPEERVDLADQIETAIRKVLQAGRTAPA
ncbi:MAG: DUF2244 domain-containing protein [Pseudomonadota bacterium]